MKDGLYNVATEWSTDVIRTVKKCRDIPYKVQPTRHFKEKCVALGLSCSVACVALKGRIIEAEIKSGCVVKLVTRIKHRYKENTDMVLRLLQMQKIKSPQLKRYGLIIQTITTAHYGLRI